jgi:hypothetical protein
MMPSLRSGVAWWKPRPAQLLNHMKGSSIHGLKYGEALADWGAVQHDTSLVRIQNDTPAKVRPGLVEAQISTQVS